MLRALFVVVVAVMVGTYADAQCPGDLDGDQRVTVDELVTAVDSALHGCDLPPNDLAQLIGVWNFQTIAGQQVFSTVVRLDNVVTFSGAQTIVGEDLTFGGPMIAGRTNDVSPSPHRFGMFRVGTDGCEIYTFNVTSPGFAEGENIVTTRTTRGCGVEVGRLPVFGYYTAPLRTEATLDHRALFDILLDVFR